MLPEAFVPQIQKLPVGTNVLLPRQDESPAVHLLQAVPQHGPVDLLQHVLPDFTS